MRNFETIVPFDPGYESMAFSFIEQIQNIKNYYAQLKNKAQKTLWLPQVEPQIIKLIEFSASFHLGCILWGGFIGCRFKSNPKEILGNTLQYLNKEELAKLDCAADAKAVLEYIKNFDKDCKYFLKRPMKISPFLIEVFESYIEFAELNENFVNTKTTKDVKLPKALKHFKKLSDAQLDELCDKIYEIIAPNDHLLALLDLGFYKV